VVISHLDTRRGLGAVFGAVLGGFLDTRTEQYQQGHIYIMYIPTYSPVLKTLQELGLVYNCGSQKIQPSQRTVSGSFVKTLWFWKGV
jgi:hypothetical protein